MAGSTCVQSAFAASSSRSICSRVSGMTSGCLNSLPLKRGRVCRSTTEKPPPSICCHSAPTSGTNCCGVSFSDSSSALKAPLAVFLRQQADILGEHGEQATGERKPATSSG